MRKTTSLLAALFALALALPAAAPALAQDGQIMASPLVPPKGPREMPDDVKSAWACVIGGAGGTAAAVLAGSENLINVVAGGIVVPANRSVLIIGLAGVVFTTFCTLGQQLTPLLLYYAGDGGASTVYPGAGSEAASAPTPSPYVASELPAGVR